MEGDDDKREWVWRKKNKQKKRNERGGVSQKNNPPTLCPFNSQHRQRETGTRPVQRTEQEVMLLISPKSWRPSKWPAGVGTRPDGD